MWDRNGLHKHRPSGVYVVDEVLLLVALMYIYREVRICRFSLKHVSEQLLVEHVDIVVQSCFPQEA
jgi:hypothetical protein